MLLMMMIDSVEIPTATILYFMVENLRITVGISMISIIVPEYFRIFGLLLSFGDTFLDVAVVGKLNFVT